MFLFPGSYTDYVMDKLRRTRHEKKNPTYTRLAISNAYATLFS